MTIQSKVRKTACITGATSGIGAAFAERFAKQGYDLVITGRRKEQIESFSNRLSTENNINVEVIILELSDDKEIALFAKKIQKIQNLEILINNAGFAKENIFYEEDFSTYEVMLKVHNLAIMKLCHTVLPNMVSNKKGIIINVASLGAFLPLPMNAVYAASKSFIKIFTESIHLELRGTGVKVQALCPGMTRTDFHEKMGFKKNTYYKEKGLMKAMTPEEVVEVSLQHLKKDKVVCIPGRQRRLLSHMLRFLPSKAVYSMVSSAAHK